MQITYKRGKRKGVYNKEDITQFKSNPNSINSNQVWNNINGRIKDDKNINNDEKQLFTDRASFFIHVQKGLSEQQFLSYFSMPHLRENLFITCYRNYIYEENEPLKAKLFYSEPNLKDTTIIFKRKIWVLLLKEIVGWRRMVKDVLENGKRTSDLTFNEACIAIRAEHDIIKDLPECKHSDGTLRRSRLFDDAMVKSYLWGKAFYLTLNLLFSDIEYVSYVTNQFVFRIKKEETVHFFFKHFGAVCRGYIINSSYKSQSRIYFRSFFTDHFNQRNFFEKIDEIIERSKCLNWNHLNAKSIAERKMLFEIDGIKYGMYFKESRNSLKDIHYFLDSFFPIKEQKMLDEINKMKSIKSGDIVFFHS